MLVIIVVFVDKVFIKWFVNLGSVVKVFAGVVLDKRASFPACMAWRDTEDTSNRGFMDVSVLKIGIASLQSLGSFAAASGRELWKCASACYGPQRRLTGARACLENTFKCLSTALAPMPLAPLQNTRRARMTRRPPVAECRDETTCLRTKILKRPQSNS